MPDNGNLPDEDNLKAENDFLKMKIMLEHGAAFFRLDEHDKELMPEIENRFLNNIIEFEKQFQQRKTISIYDKIGKPQQFKPVHEIAANAIEEEWNKLLEYLQQHGVDLSASSPKVTARELYRFTTEELFQYETDDIHIPGMINGFIYDEFYPDYEYDNTRYAIDDCIKLILRKEPVDIMPGLAKENISLNQYINFTEEAFKEIVNSFKERFDDIELNAIENISCDLQEAICAVSGTR